MPILWLAVTNKSMCETLYETGGTTLQLFYFIEINFNSE